jgi:hypothetical protein
VTKLAVVGVKPSIGTLGVFRSWAVVKGFKHVSYPGNSRWRVNANEWNVCATIGYLGRSGRVPVGATELTPTMSIVLVLGMAGIGCAGLVTELTLGVACPLLVVCGLGVALATKNYSWAATTRSH